MYIVLFNKNASTFIEFFFTHWGVESECDDIVDSLKSSDNAVLCSTTDDIGSI